MTPRPGGWRRPARVAGACVAAAALAAAEARGAHATTPAAPAPATASAVAAPPTPVPTPETLPDAAAGYATYRDRCASCHGPYGRGDGEMAARLPSPPPRLDDPQRMRQVAPAELYDIVTNGRLDKGMPPWSQALDAQERWQALYAAWSFYLTPRRLAQGRAVWRARCAACHALPGAPAPTAGAPAPPLGDAAWLMARSHAGLHAGYTAAAVAHTATADVADGDLRAALDFVRSAAFRPLGPDDGTLDGVIAGRVVNGSAGPPGADPPTAAGARVVAVPFSHALNDILPGEPVTATVAATGGYTLTGLLAGSDVAYRVVATYGGVDFVPPDAVPLAADAARAEAVDITVYEPSADVALAVGAARIVVIPRPADGVLDVAEAWTIRNASDRTRVAAGGGATLRLPLLPGAFEIQIDDFRVSGSARLEGGAVVSDVPVPPGDLPVIIGYTAPYDGTTVAIDRRLDWPVDALDVVVAGDGVGIAGGGLTAGAPTTLGERGPAATARGTGLAAGARLRIALTGLPEPAAAAADPRLTRPLAPAVVGPTGVIAAGTGFALVAALLGIAVPLWRRRGAGRRRAGRWLHDERRRLVDEIARLDRMAAVSPEAAAGLAGRRARLVDRALAVSRALSEMGEERP